MGGEERQVWRYAERWRFPADVNSCHEEGRCFHRWSLTIV